MILKTKLSRRIQALQSFMLRRNLTIPLITQEEGVSPGWTLAVRKMIILSSWNFLVGFSTLFKGNSSSQLQTSFSSVMSLNEDKVNMSIFLPSILWVRVCFWKYISWEPLQALNIRWQYCWFSLQVQGQMKATWVSSFSLALFFMLISDVKHFCLLSYLKKIR